MIEVRSFDGTADELSSFSKQAFRATYGGRTLAPQYSPQHFERDLLAERADSDLIIVAYDGTRLVGMHPFRPVAIRAHGKVTTATLGAYLVVEPEYRRRGVAFKLQAEYVRRHLERELSVNFGFLWERTSALLGPHFWRAQPSGCGVRAVARLGTWVRALDHAAVADFELFPIEAWGARALKRVQGPPRAPENMAGLREYEPRDLDDGVRLLNRASQKADLGYLWNRSTAARQLSYPGLSRTIVLESRRLPPAPSGGDPTSETDEQEAPVGLRGLVSYSLIDILGKSVMRQARIDALALDDDVAPADRRRLLQAALHAMALDGAKGVYLLRGSWDHWRDLLDTGFFPLAPEYTYAALLLNETPSAEDEALLRDVRRLSILLL